MAQVEACRRGGGGGAASVGEARGDVDLQELHPPAASTTASVRDTSRSPRSWCAAKATSASAAAVAASSRAGQWKCAAPGGVAGGVVVHPALRLAPRRPAARAGPSPSTTVTATSTPETNCSASTVSAYARQLTIAAGSSARLLTTCAPSAEPPWSGLSMSGRPSRSTIASSTACAPERPERGVRQRDPVRGVEARAGELGLRGGFVPRPAARARRGTDERHAQQLQHRLHGAVLALATVQRDRDRVGRVGPQVIDERAVDVPLAHVDADAAEGRRQPPSRAQRHLALVGDAARQHRDGRSPASLRIAGLRRQREGSGGPGGGVLTACSATAPAARADGGRAGLPNVCSTSSSAASTRPAAGRPR